MPGVYHCSPTNSTHFTTCCETAITDRERCCPRCGEPVYPHHSRYGEDPEEDKYSDHYRSMARHRQAMAKSR
jgi:predicted amidophosphoribosyltransferase